MDRGGPGGAQLGQPAANTGMQRGGGNLNAALFLNNQVRFSLFSLLLPCCLLSCYLDALAPSICLRLHTRVGA